MIIGYIESGEIEIHSTDKEALQKWKPFAEDVISGVVLFYTLQGKYLEPSPLYKKRKWYRMNASIETIDLNATDPEKAGQDSLLYLLEHEATSLKLNVHVASLEELIKKVKGY